jgi:hypothetical protein
MFNPKLKDFLANQPEGKTLLGFAWSIYWRWLVVVFGFYIGLIVLIVVLSAL